MNIIRLLRNTSPISLTETQRIGNSHLRKVSVSESNVLLDEEVLTDPKIQALLLTVLVRTHLHETANALYRCSVMLRGYLDILF